MKNLSRRGLPTLLLTTLLWAAVVAAPWPWGKEEAKDSPTLSTSLCLSRNECNPFSGDVYPKAGLVASLEARSWQQELVLISETRMAPAYQAYDDFRRLGIDHVLWLTDKADKCARSTAQLPSLACGWSTQEWPAQLNAMHMVRVAYLARAIRLGYNVLLVDADIIMFHDPYLFLKHPPLNEFNVLIMRDGNGLVNTGVMYMQNVRPDGASAYLASEVVDRPLRWLENGTLLEAKDRVANCWEQSVYTDAVLSTVLGRPVFFSCFNPGGEAAALTWHDAHQKRFGVGTRPLSEASYLTRSELPWPATLSPPTAGAPLYTDLFQSPIRVPTIGQEGWPEELGGPVFAEPRGAMSHQWQDVLKGDVLPLWPCPEDPAAAPKSRASNVTEKFAFLPNWFVSSWSDGGAKGWWLDGVVGQTHPQVMAHFVHVPGGSSNKPVIKMTTHHWNWTLHHLAKHESGNVFHASTTAVPMPQLLGYDTSVENLLWATEAEYVTAVKNLVLLAIITKRTAVYPPFRCKVPWYGSGARMAKAPYEVNPGQAIMYGRAPDVMCMWEGYLTYACQEAKTWGGGLLPLEFEHYLTLIKPTGVKVLALTSALAGVLPAGVVAIEPVVSTAAATANFALQAAAAAVTKKVAPGEVLRAAAAAAGAAAVAASTAATATADAVLGGKKAGVPVRVAGKPTSVIGMCGSSACKDAPDVEARWLATQVKATPRTASAGAAASAVAPAALVAVQPPKGMIDVGPKADLVDTRVKQTAAAAGGAAGSLPQLLKGPDSGTFHKKKKFKSMGAVRRLNHASGGAAGLLIPADTANGVSAAQHRGGGVHRPRARRLHQAGLAAAAAAAVEAAPAAAAAGEGKAAASAAAGVPAAAATAAATVYPPQETAPLVKVIKAMWETDVVLLDAALMYRLSDVPQEALDVVAHLQKAFSCFAEH